MIADETIAGAGSTDALQLRIEAIEASLSNQAAITAEQVGDELVAIGERVLETWLEARGIRPSYDRVEGFRLLALHRQGAKGDPSFNACRESCRELIYQTNCALAADSPEETIRHLRLASMVARHLTLFISGKLQEAGLGDFCCSSRPMRLRNDQDSAQESLE